MTQAVILAGGLGTRLGELTKTMPKPMLPVGGRPFLEIIVSELKRQDIDNILIIAGFRGSLIDRNFATMPGVEVVIEPAPMGTGGALSYARSSLESTFFVLNGDSLFDVNLYDLALSGQGALATLALRQMADVSRYGPAEIDESGVIVRIAERPDRIGPGLINGGVGYFYKDILDYIRSDEFVSIERDVYPILVSESRLLGRVYDRPFIDIGVPDDFERSQTFIPSLLKRPTIIFAQDCLLRVDRDDACRAEHKRLIKGAKEAIKLANDAGFLVLVAPNNSEDQLDSYAETHIHVAHRWLLNELHATGAHIDGLYSWSKAVSDSMSPARFSTLSPKLLDVTVSDTMDSYLIDRCRCLLVSGCEANVKAARDIGIDGACFQGGNLSDFLSMLVSIRNWAG